MKRDMELVRKILLALEEYPHGHVPDGIRIEGYSEEQVGHHAYLMKEAGLIRGADVTTLESPSPFVLPVGITWAGHEFIEAARSETIWNKAKQKVKEKGLELGALGFGALTDYLKQLVKEQLGLS